MRAVDVLGAEFHGDDEPVPVGRLGPARLRHAHMNAPPSAMNVWPVR
jgi:hypothetical protein